MAISVHGVRSALRKVKDLQYADIEIKVRDATSNDPWGTKRSLLQEIAKATQDFDQYSKLFNMLWKRVMDINHVKHVEKALVCVEYLLIHGADRFIKDCKLKSRDIQRLKKYKHYDANSEDDAKEARAAAKRVFELLSNDKLLQEERTKANKLAASSPYVGMSNESYVPGRAAPSADDDEEEDKRPAKATASPDDDPFGPPTDPGAEPAPKKKAPATAPKPKAGGSATKPKDKQPRRPSGDGQATATKDDPFDADFAEDGAAAQYEAQAKKKDIMAGFDDDDEPPLVGRSPPKGTGPDLLSGDDNWAGEDAFGEEPAEVGGSAPAAAAPAAAAPKASSDPWDMFGDIGGGGGAPKPAAAVKPAMKDLAASKPQDFDFGSSNPFADFSAPSAGAKPAAQSHFPAATAAPSAGYDPFGGLAAPGASSGGYDPFGSLPAGGAPVSAPVASTAAKKPVVDAFADLGF
jgi:epsin